MSIFSLIIIVFWEPVPIFTIQALPGKKRSDKKDTESQQDKSHDDADGPPVFLPPAVNSLQGEAKHDGTEDQNEGQYEEDVVDEEQGDSFCHRHFIGYQGKDCQVDAPVQGSSNMPTSTPRIMDAGTDAFWI